MNPRDAEAKIKLFGPLIDAGLFAAKMREFERGGLPGASMSDGRGASEPPLPLIGKIDRRIQQDRLLYTQALLHAALALEQASKIQDHWCRRLDTDSEKAEKLAEDAPRGSGACANVWCPESCSGFGNDRLRQGRCRACYRVFKLEGRDRDPRKEGMAS